MRFEIKFLFYLSEELGKPTQKMLSVLGEPIYLSKKLGNSFRKEK